MQKRNLYSLFPQVSPTIESKILVVQASFFAKQVEAEKKKAHQGKNTSKLGKEINEMETNDFIINQPDSSKQEQNPALARI